MRGYWVLSSEPQGLGSCFVNKPLPSIPRGNFYDEPCHQISLEILDRYSTTEPCSSQRKFKLVYL